MDGGTMSARVLASNMAWVWLAALAACTPKIEVQAPSEPITINLNVKIEHEIRVKVDKDLEDLFDDEDDIF